MAAPTPKPLPREVRWALWDRVWQEKLLVPRPAASPERDRPAEAEPPPARDAQPGSSVQEAR